VYRHNDTWEGLKKYPVEVCSGVMLRILNFVKTEKNGVFWDVTPRGSCKNRHLRVTYRLIHQGDKNR
jgi:hypothetical protein